MISTHSFGTCIALLCSLALVSTAVKADPIRLKVGETLVLGDVALKVKAPDGTEKSISVRHILRETSANDKAELIAGKFTGDWRALRPGNADVLTFQHKENGVWKDIYCIKRWDDTTGEDNEFRSQASHGVFDFGLGAGLACGDDGNDNPSIVTIATNEGQASVYPNEGDGAAAIVRVLYDDLVADGVDIALTSSLTFRIRDSFIAFRSTDRCLPVEGAGGLVLGACCLIDGSCVAGPLAECEAMRGTFLGDAVSCDPNPCSQHPNAGGALVVHTEDAISWTGTCDMFDDVVPQHCVCLNTQTNNDENTPTLIWFVAAFPEMANPGVSVVYFGNDHNLPEFYHNRWGFCDNGTTGSVEVPDIGWPEFPAIAGTSVAYGQPILGDNLFPVYYFDVWGFAGANYCSGINPTGEYAAFVDDSNPPLTDLIAMFGCVRWYEQGHNDCPDAGPVPGACCSIDGSCQVLFEDECSQIGGDHWICGGDCDPNPCDQPPLGACCHGCMECLALAEAECSDLPDDYMWIEGEDCDPNPCPPTASETTTWGRIKASYR